MCSAAEGGLSVARSAGPGDASDKAAVRIQVAVRTTPDTSCYDAKDHTTMAARSEADKAEGAAMRKLCARVLNLGARRARRPMSYTPAVRRTLRRFTESVGAFEHAPAIDNSRSNIGAGRSRSLLCSVLLSY